MHHSIKVQEGQCYKEMGRPTVWEVRSVSDVFLAVPHAWLVNPEDPRVFKLVACHALADAQSFKLVSEPEMQVGTEAA